MSKRYGRNQKRRHRETIAQLETEKRGLILWEQAKAEERRILEARLQDQKAHVREIADTINGVVAYSALLPPRQGPFGRDPGDNPLRVRLVQRRTMLDRCVPDREGVLPADLDVPILELDLWELRTILEKNLETFARLVHMLLPGPAGMVYRVSEATYRQLQRAHALPEVARIIFQQILKALQAADR